MEKEIKFSACDKFIALRRFGFLRNSRLEKILPVSQGAERKLTVSLGTMPEF